MKHPPIPILENTRDSTFCGAIYEMIYFDSFNNLNLSINASNNDNLYYKNDPLIDSYFILNIFLCEWIEKEERIRGK